MNQIQLRAAVLPAFNFVDEEYWEDVKEALLAVYAMFCDVSPEGIPTACELLNDSYEYFPDTTHPLHDALDIHYSQHLHCIKPDEFRSNDDFCYSEWDLDIYSDIPIIQEIPPETAFFIYEHFLNGIGDDYVREIEIALSHLGIVFRDSLNLKKIIGHPITEVW